MDQILKFIQALKVIHLVAFVLMITNVSITQATVVTYNITGTLYEPMTQPNNTVFNGSFGWDGAVVSNLHGTMNSSMYETDDVNPIPGVTFPLMHLNYQLAQNVDGNIVTANVFLENTTDVFFGGGYKTGDFFRYGSSESGGDGNVPNENAYFSFSFDKSTMAGIVDSLVYADCTPGGMMGEFCMTGHSSTNLGYNGTMDAYPSSLIISAVPVPAAIWLFGTALAGMIGVSRKRVQSV